MVLSMASIAPGVDKANKGSLAVDKVSSRTTFNTSQDDSREAVSMSSVFSPPWIYIWYVKY